MIAISRRWLIKIGKYNKGVIYKYCKNVSNASKGCVTDN